MRVKTADEILATLDGDGSLEGMPFMPEMLKHCGRYYQIQASAHKTCDTVNKTGITTVDSAVHLAGTRCGGEAHGGCHAQCLLFWKRAWLVPVDEPGVITPDPTATDPLRSKLEATTRRELPEPTAEPVYRCQATELPRFTKSAHWANPRLYWDDLRSSNVSIGQAFFTMLIAAFNGIQRRRKGRQYPDLWRTTWQTTTPKGTLDLQPGELVRIKSKDEILNTLDSKLRNRGLSFDTDMVSYCGRTARVLSRVERLINEKTGRMETIKSDCIVLEGVFCDSRMSERRRLCPRAIYAYWRELWLERIPPDEAAHPVGQNRPAATLVR